MLSRKRTFSKPTKIINLGALRRENVLILKEDPLEAIMRTIVKPISLKERIRYDDVVGGYVYHPSHAYFEFMSKTYPIRKKN